MRRVCIVVQNYYDIDPRVRRTAECLIEAGDFVDVLCLRMRGKREKHYSLNKVQVYTIPLPKRRAGKLQYFLEYFIFGAWATLILSYRMLRYSYQIIHVNTLPDSLVFCALIPKFMGAKVILDMHEVMPEFFMSKYRVPETHPMIRLLKWQEKLSIRFADHVIVINEPIKKLLEMRNLPPEKATVITNSVDEHLFIPIKGNSSDGNSFIFMYHGTLTHIYGLDIALEAFSKASAQLPQAEFWIIGDGPERFNLENQAKRLGIKDRVNFVGVLPQEDIPAQLAKCDVGVLPTRRDQFLELSFSNKLPEYIIMEKPVIASRLKAIRHYFSEEAIAFFEPENATDLAEKMIELYNSPEKRMGYAEHALREYADIRWERMKQLYLEVVHRLITSK